MKFIQILKQLFPERISLQEFIDANNPVTLQDIDFLERKYWELEEHWRFFTKD